MNKIMTGTLGVLATGVVVTTAAYAAFTSQATISGINFSTGTSALEVSADNSSFDDLLEANINIQNAFPGFGMDNSQKASFWLKNNAAAGSPNMTVNAQLTSAGGWGSGLENYVELAVVPFGTAANTIDDGEYMTLTEWNSEPRQLTTDLAVGANQQFEAYVRFLPTAPNSVADKDLTNITFTLNGATVTVTPAP